MNLHDIAKEVLEVLGTGRQLDPFSKVYPDFGLKDAYQVTATVRAAEKRAGSAPSAARSGSPTGPSGRNMASTRRSGATSTTGRSRTSTPRELEVSLSGLAEPRIEPEIVFGLAAPPAPGMDEQALIHCIDWIAHGFEIVQSIFPNWSFLAPRHRRRLRSSWAALHRPPSFGGVPTGGVGARAFPIRNRSVSQRGPCRPWGCGQRARRASVCVTASRRDAGER